MKLNQAIEKLIENPKDVYEIFSVGKRHELSVTDNGYFDFKTFHNGKELSRDRGGAWFGGNISVSSDWQLVRKPVDFMTAMNLDQNVKPEKFNREIGFMKPSSWLNNISLTVEVINGKWLVE